MTTPIGKMLVVQCPTCKHNVAALDLDQTGNNDIGRTVHNAAAKDRNIIIQPHQIVQMQACTCKHAN